MKIPEIPEAYRPTQQQYHGHKTSIDAHLTREYLRQIRDVVAMQQVLIDTLQNRVATLENPTAVNPMYTPTVDAGENPVSDVKVKKNK
jgi:hypothetical protein